MRLAGKFAIVTGGSEGLGLAMAEALAREGADLCIVGRNAKKLADAAQQLGSSLKLSVSADLATDQGLDRAIEEVRKSGRSVDVLVNNAAVAQVIDFEKVKRSDYEYELSINVAAPYFLTQRLMPHLRSPGCSIINISSYFAQKAIMNRPMSVYSLTKGAMNAMTKALAFELGPKGIRINAIAPGSVDTPMRRKSVDVMSPERQAELREYVKRSYPLGRIGKPSDLGGIAIYLASDESSWVTGSIFAIDGGLTAG
jgi:NAD(P)-dependent dehydrogenase (short-subunit alcohol dehydrogenase family)